MPGSTPATSQLDWLISMTAMIVLFWSRATRDLLKSFSWGIAELHRFMQRRSCHVLAARPIASLGPSRGQNAVGARLPETLGCAAAIPRGTVAAVGDEFDCACQYLAADLRHRAQPCSGC